MLTGVCRVKGDVLFDVQQQVEPGGKVSEGIVAIKQKAMAGINAYIAAHNLRNDDVDMLEEVAGEDDTEGKPKGSSRGGSKSAGGGGKGRKRKHT